MKKTTRNILPSASNTIKKIQPAYGFVLLLSLFLQNSIHAQADALRPVTDLLNEHKTSGIEEKIYVHTDKNYYLTGEILWFKIYYTDAVTLKPIDVSKIAYLELLDGKNQSVQEVKVGLNKGEGTGSVFLSQNLVSGNYKLRAYTHWMKNFDVDYFFEKPITIVNLNKLPDSPLTPKDRPMDIQFFPEGGNLIQGINNKIAFKGTDEYGIGLQFSGYILDNKDTLFRFSPLHAGMGHFLLQPKAGHHYSAVIIPPSGTVFEKELPPVLPSGTTLLLSRPDSQSLLITAYTNDPTQKELHLLAHTRSSVKATLTSPVQDGKALFYISTTQLGEGISQLTVFNNDKKPVCERLFFKRPEQSLQLRLHPNQAVYNYRSAGDIEISAQGLSNSDIASLSLTIYSLDSLQKTDSSDIQHYLYLSSDLKGVIENPGYYFNAGAQAAEAADNLMLTQGWRRFVWDDILSAKKPSFAYPPEIRGHLVTGQVINSLSGTAKSGVATYLSAPASITEFGNSISDEKGFVKYEMNNFFGGTKIIAQTNPLSEDSIYRVEIYSPFSKKYSATKLVPFAKPVNNPETLLQQNINMQVQNIYGGNKMHQFSYPYFTDTASFFVTPDYFYKLDNYTRFTSMEEVLREYVTLVNVRRRNGRVELPIVDVQNQQYLPGELLNLLDGTPVFDFTRFFEFDPLKIKSLDVITNRYISGQMMFSGILNWKTYKPSLENYKTYSNTWVADYEGMLMEREFYTPAYNIPENRSSKIPDYRNVLLWDPNIKLNGSISKGIQFFTSDLPGKYIAIVEGISLSGVAGSSSTTFEVR